MRLEDFARLPLLFGPSPLQELPRLSAALGGKVEIWAKREDCNSGIAFGGNKVRKLEYLAADAIAQGCVTLVSIGGVQSNQDIDNQLLECGRRCAFYPIQKLSSEKLAKAPVAYSNFLIRR